MGAAAWFMYIDRIRYCVTCWFNESLSRLNKSKEYWERQNIDFIESYETFTIKNHVRWEGVPSPMVRFSL
jgi:hypothetical protein